MSPHVDRLFSEAYDRRLLGVQRADFDDHLEACSACARGFADFAASIDAVRELPMARMPRPVRLPEAPPLRARRPARSAWLAGWRRPLITVASVAAALVLVLAVTQNPRGGGGSRSALQSGGGVVAAPQPSASCPDRGCSAAGVATRPCVPQPLRIDVAAGARIPSGFNNSVTHRDGNGTLLLATPSTSYSPGETVLVYARHVDAAGTAVDLPCVGLSLSPGGVASPGMQVPAAVVQPAVLSESVGAGGPLYQVTVPRSTRHGDSLVLAADLPPSPAMPSPDQLTLILQVR